MSTRWWRLTDAGRPSKAVRDGLRSPSYGAKPFVLWALLLVVPIGCRRIEQPEAKITPAPSVEEKDQGKDPPDEFPKETIAVLRGHTRAASAVAFSPSGKLLASSGWDNTVRLWKLDGETPREWQVLPGSASGVAFSSDGKMLAAGSHGTSVFLWDITGEKVKKIQALAGHQQRPFAVAFSPDGKMLATGCQGPLIRIWKMENGEAEAWAALEEEGEDSLGVSCLAFSSDSKKLAAGGFTGKKSLRVWDVGGGFMDEKAVPAMEARQVAWSPDGKSLAMLAGDHAGILINADQPKEKTKLVGGIADGRPALGAGALLAFLPDGSKLAIVRPDRKIMLWDVSAAKLAGELAFGQGIRGIAFASDGRLAAGLEDGAVAIVRSMR